MGCLDRRSKLEIILMVSTIIFLLSSIGLMIGLIEVKEESINFFKFSTMIKI
jgi:hypothetical protein